MNAQRIVVTGGAGFIGVHTVEALLAGGAAVMAVDDLRHASSRGLPAAARLEAVDIASEQARGAIESFRPTAILHLAAQGGVNRSWREPAADARINVLGTVSVLVAAAAAGCSRVVIASSGGALYGAAERIPTGEDSPRRPRSPYGAAKLTAETYLEHHTRAGVIAGLALRYGNVYGPGQDGTGEAGVVAISSHRLLGGQAPIVRGDGLQTRDFVYVGDVVAANLLALTAAVTGAVNIGTGRETSVAEVVARLSAHAGFAAEVEHAPLPGGEVARSALDIRRARDTLGWTAVMDLDAGLATTLRSFQG